VSQGVVQTFDSYHEVTLLEPAVDAEGKVITTQTIAVGPAASQVAIKQLGTNGGGFFNVNSAHPLENPTPLCNFLQMLAILLIPAALCFTFSEMVGDRRQGWALLTAMLVIFVPLLVVTVMAEQAGNPVLAQLNVDQTATESQPGGNMEGKETRFGIANSALWAVATTAASNGSVNSMHDSFMPLGGLVPMWLMQLGEVVFGGVGSPSRSKSSWKSPPFPPVRPGSNRVRVFGSLLLHPPFACRRLSSQQMAQRRVTPRCGDCIADAAAIPAGRTGRLFAVIWSSVTGNCRRS
jgi:K+-transporting ATPase ATPase A chain